MYILIFLIEYNTDNTDFKLNIEIVYQSYNQIKTFQYSSNNESFGFEENDWPGQNFNFDL